MDANRRLFRYLSRDFLKGLWVFWLVMIIVNTLSAVFSYRTVPNSTYGPMIVSNETVSFAGSNLLAIFIFFIIYGIVIYYENFSLAGAFGVTRKNYYMNLIVNNLLIVIIFAVVQILIMKVDNMVVDWIGYTPMVEFGIFNMNDNIILNILSLAFSFLVLVSLGNLLGVLQYRFGIKFWAVLGITVVLLQLVTNFIGAIFRGIGFLIDAVINGGFIIGILIIIFSYSIGYLAFRRVNVK